MLRDTEENRALGRRRGRLMRKEEERAEAEERPIYPVTTPKEISEKSRRKK